MSIFSIVCWTLVLGFWAGYGWRAWGERQAGQRVSDAMKIRDTMVSQAKAIDLMHKCAGRGVTVAKHATLTVDGKQYDVTVKR